MYVLSILTVFMFLCACARLSTQDLYKRINVPATQSLFFGGCGGGQEAREKKGQEAPQSAGQSNQESAPDASSHGELRVSAGPALSARSCAAPKPVGQGRGESISTYPDSQRFRQV